MNEHTDTAAPVSIDVQIVCVERELRMRERVYPRWITTSKMTPKKADDEMTAMRAVLETLKEIRAKEMLL